LNVGDLKAIYGCPFCWIYFDSLGVRLKVTPSYFRRHSERLISDRDEVLKKLNLDKQDGA